MRFPEATTCRIGLGASRGNLLFQIRQVFGGVVTLSVDDVYVRRNRDEALVDKLVRFPVCEETERKCEVYMAMEYGGRFSGVMW